MFLSDDDYEALVELDLDEDGLDDFATADRQGDGGRRLGKLVALLVLLDQYEDALEGSFWRLGHDLADIYTGDMTLRQLWLRINVRSHRTALAVGSGTARGTRQGRGAQARLPRSTTSIRATRAKGDPMTEEAGWVALGVKPVLDRGFDSTLSRGLDPALSRVGQTSGKRFGAILGKAAVAGAVGIIGAGFAAFRFGKDALAEAREAQEIGATSVAILKSTEHAAKLTRKEYDGLTSR